MAPLIIAVALTGQSASAAPQDVITGVWGGDRLVAEFSAQGARIQQDCAEGAIPAPVHVDGGGRFAVAGVYEVERPGPQMEGRASLPASFSGEIVGATMRLTIRQVGGAAARTYVLQRDARVKLIRCY
jgi:hypothetical protein